MNFTSKGTREILVAGCQDKMFKVDVEKGTIVDAVMPLLQRVGESR
jgi:PAB-dependent poly(A)-specific ribonuclease subunit 2